MLLIKFKRAQKVKYYATVSRLCVIGIRAPVAFRMCEKCLLCNRVLITTRGVKVRVLSRTKELCHCSTTPTRYALLVDAT